MCGDRAALCVRVNRLHARGAVTGFKNVPAPARQTPSINPENYTFRFPQDKKWTIQNSCPKAGRFFFGKKGQKHFLDSIRSGLTHPERPLNYTGTRLKSYISTRIYSLRKNLDASKPDDDEHRPKRRGKCQNVQVGTMDATTKSFHEIQVGSPTLSK